MSLDCLLLGILRFDLLPSFFLLQGLLIEVRVSDRFRVDAFFFFSVVRVGVRTPPRPSLLRPQPTSFSFSLILWLVSDLVSLSVEPLVFAQPWHRGLVL